MELRFKPIFAGVSLMLCALPFSASGSERPSANDPELAALAAKLPGALINDPRQLLAMGNNLGGANAAIIKSRDIPGGGAALQVRLDHPADADWKVATKLPLTAAIAKGEVVTVGFYGRALPTAAGANGSLTVRLQQTSDPWPGFIDRKVDLDGTWRWYEVSGVANVALAKGTAGLVMNMGDRAQTLELGQVIIIKGAPAILGAATPVQPSPGAAKALPPSLQSIAGELIDDPAGGPWGFHGASATVTPIQDKGVFGGKATRIAVNSATGAAWDVTTAIPLNAAIAEGEALTVAIAIRTVSAQSADGKAVVGLRFQRNQPPYEGFADSHFSPGPNWQIIRVRTTADNAIPAGQASFNLFFGGAVQVVDVGPVYVFRMKP